MSDTSKNYFYCKGYVDGYLDAQKGKDFLIDIYKKCVAFQQGYDVGYEDGVYNEKPDFEVINT